MAFLSNRFDLIRQFLILLAIGTLLCLAGNVQAAGFSLGRETIQLENKQTVVVLNWEPMPLAKQYRVLVAEDAEFKHIVADKKCSSNTLSLNGLRQDRAFFWKVAADKGSGAKTWNDGAPGTFSTPNLADILQTIDAPKATPTLDGRIHMEQWAKAGAMNLNYRIFGSSSFAGVQSPRGWVLWDDTNLYVLGEMQMLSGRAPQATIDQRDGPVWVDDDFEVFLQAPGDRYYYQMATNGKLAQFDGRNTDGAWNGTWQVLTATENGAFRIMFIVPFAQFGVQPKAGQNWRFNLSGKFAREDVSPTWAAVTVPHEPDKFGTLRLVEK